MNFYDDLEWRGLIKQVTDPELKGALSRSPLTLYCGFDPTSDSLHIGSLLPLLVLKRFQMAGHKPIAVIGGATGLIGDPSGKSAERNLLTEETIAKNLAGIKKVIGRFLEVKGPNAARIVNNGDWFGPMRASDFLRDVGKHFTVNAMMAKESVRARLEDREHGISYTEFSYMLLQAYDFLVLNQRENCTLQVGGSDQWGNITAGCELIRRVAAHEGREAPHVFGLTHPLVTKADGSKFGKSEKGNLWLDAEKTSPYELYQYFLRTPDAEVVTFLKYFTFFDKDTIAGLETSLKKEPEKRLAQKALAESITDLVHGKEARLEAEAAAQALFSGNLKTATLATLQEVLAEAPRSERKKSEIKAGVMLIDLLVETKLCPSKGIARKDVTAGGIYLNNERVQDPQYKLSGEDLIEGKLALLRKGKKTYHAVFFE